VAATPAELTAPAVIVGSAVAVVSADAALMTAAPNSTYSGITSGHTDVSASTPPPLTPTVSWLLDELASLDLLGSLLVLLVVDESPPLRETSAAVTTSPAAGLRGAAPATARRDLGDWRR